MVKWVTFSKVTPYYLILSPFVKKVLEEDENLKIYPDDIDIYKNSVTEDVINNFKELFSNEF
jgi:hypothetical protein